MPSHADVRGGEASSVRFFKSPVLGCGFGGSASFEEDGLALKELSGAEEEEFVCEEFVCEDDFFDTWARYGDFQAGSDEGPRVQELCVSGNEEFPGIQGFLTGGTFASEECLEVLQKGFGVLPSATRSIMSGSGGAVVCGLYRTPH